MAKKKPLENLARPFSFTDIPKELKQSQKELDWFFYEGESSCGLTSNHEALMFQMAGSIGVSDITEQFVEYIDKKRSQEQIFRSVSKYRKINNKFNKLPVITQRTLELFYYEQQFDRSLEGHFGPGLKLVPHTKAFNDLPKQWQNHEKLKYCLIHQRKLIDRMKKEVKELYLQSLKQYSEVKDEQ